MNNNQAMPNFRPFKYEHNKATIYEGMADAYPNIDHALVYGRPRNNPHFRQALHRSWRRYLKVHIDFYLIMYQVCYPLSSQ